MRHLRTWHIGNGSARPNMPRASRSCVLSSFIVVALLTLLTWTVYHGELVRGDTATRSLVNGDGGLQLDLSVHGGAESQHVTTAMTSLSEHPNITVRREVS